MNQNITPEISQDNEYDDKSSTIQTMKNNANAISDKMVGSLNQLHNEMDYVLYGLKAFDGIVESQTLRSSQERIRAKRKVKSKEDRISTRTQLFFVKIQQNQPPQQISFNAEQICLICYEPMQKPATLPCEHTFCALCLLRCSQLWSPKTCPLCGVEYSRFPNINMILEAQIFKTLRAGWQACVGDLVKTLVSDEQTQAFSFGIVDSLQQGYVSKDMMTLVVEDLGALDDFENDQFLETKIAHVNLGIRRWEGKISDTEVIRFQNCVIGTRIMRGGLVINKKFVKRQDYIIGELQSVPSSYKSPQQKLKIPMRLQTANTNKKEATPDLEQEVINAVKNPNRDAKQLVQSNTNDNNAQPDHRSFQYSQYESIAISKQSDSNALQNSKDTQQIQQSITQTPNAKIQNKNSDLRSSQLNVDNIQQNSKDTMNQKANLAQNQNSNDEDSDVNEQLVKDIVAEGKKQQKKKTVIKQRSLDNEQELSNNEAREPSLLNDDDNFEDRTKPIMEMMKDMEEYSNKVLSKEYVYDSQFPKQQPVVFSPYQIGSGSEICILYAHESVTNKHQIIDQKQNSINIEQTLAQYLSLVTDFDYLQKCPQFCCNGCKQLLRIPVVLSCGCQYCYQCSVALQILSFDCLGCGKPIAKKINLKSINKQLTLQLYSKLPKHSPMIDRGLPVKIKDKIGLLLDDPNRVNVWVMLSKSQNTYVHFSDLTAINICNAQTAIRPLDGIVYYESQFHLLQQSPGKNMLYSVDCIQGRQISEQDMYYKCLRLVEDLREQIVVSKIEGTKILQNKHDNAVKVEKKRLIEEQKETEKNKKIQEKHNQHVNNSNKNLKLDQQTAERRKKLHLVGMDNPDAVSHPGNIMVYNYNDKEIQKQKFQNGIKAQDVASYMISQKPVLIQMCYMYPKLNFLCSACWSVLKRPMQLPCGHIICRTCCCIYQAAGLKCLLCHTAIGSVIDCQPDLKLHAQLMLTDEVYSQRGIDVGCFVSEISAPQLGIVSKVIVGSPETMVDVTYPEGSRSIQISKLALLEYKKVLEDDLCLGAPCMTVIGKWKGILGLITAVPEQQNEICNTLRQQLQQESDAFILEVTLETGVKHLFPLNYLRKVEVLVSKKQYKNFMEDKALIDKQDEDEIRQIAIQQIQDEQNKNVEQQEMQKAFDQERKDIWNNPKEQEKRKDYKGY